MPISAEKFKNITDLVHYLNDLEAKLGVLEEENKALRNSIDDMSQRNRDMVDFIKASWPKTSLFSSSFWVRALSVFGHNLVIQLIIGVLLFIVYLLLLAPIIAQLLGGASGMLQ